MRAVRGERSGPRRPAVRAPGGRSGDDRYILYTGGTTGVPAGVVWRHDDLLSGALATAAGEESAPADAARASSSGRVENRLRCLPASPLNHGAAQWSALATLFGGGTVVLVGRLRRRGALVGRRGGGGHHPRDRGRRLRPAARRRPRRRAGPLGPQPAAVGHLGRRAAVGHRPRRSCSPACRGSRWSTGTAPRRPAAIGHSVAWPGQADPGTSRFEVGAAHRGARRRTGSPCPRARARSGWSPTAVAVPIGYHGDEAESARVFPMIDGVRWALPGDLATVEADGSVRLLGRGASSINSGGEKVSPEEVEAVLKSHPDVFDAVVLGVADDRWGERVVAARAAPRGVCPRTDDLTDHCRAELADFKVPRQVVLVDAIERLSTGKADLAWARAVVRSERGPALWLPFALMEFNLALVNDAIARAYPDRECIVWGEKRFTYGDLAERTTPPGQRAPRPGPRHPPAAVRSSTGHESGPGPARALPLQRQRVPRGHARRVPGPGRAVQRQLPLRRRRAALPAQGRRRARHRLPLLLRPDPGRGAARPARPRGAGPGGRRLRRGAARRRGRLRAACSPPPRTRSRSTTSRPTTSTSSTRAARPACRRACCGGSTTSSSAPWAAGPSAAATSFTSYDEIVESAGRGGLKVIATPPLMHGAAQWSTVHLLHRRRHRRHARGDPPPRPRRGLEGGRGREGAHDAGGGRRLRPAAHRGARERASTTRRASSCSSTAARR